MRSQVNRRAMSIPQRVSARGNDLFIDASRKVEENIKCVSDIASRAQKESKTLRADAKGMGDTIVQYSKMMSNWGLSENDTVDSMRKLGDFQKWIEEFRNQMSNEAFNKLHIPLSEYVAEDAEQLKIEKKKMESDTAEDPLNSLANIVRRTEFKILVKMTEFVHVYHVYFKVGLKKLDDMKAILEEKKKKYEEEVLKIDSMRKMRKGTVFDAPVFNEFKYFGTALSEILARDKSTIPTFLQAAFSYLEKNSLATQGLFRIGANQDDLRVVKELINSGAKYTLEGVAEHTVSGLIKAYFRELPEPLLTLQLFSGFVKANAIDDHEPRVAEVKKLIYQLPPQNRIVLRALITLCAKIAKNCDINKMTSNNISIVICPNVLYSKETNTMTMVEDISSSQNIFSTIIEAYKEIFEADLLEASLCGDTDLIRELLEKEDTQILETKDAEGNTALHKAVEGNHLDIARQLVGKNIEIINAKNAAGKTALEAADEIDRFYTADSRTFLKETTEKYKAKWKKTLLNKAASERRLAIGEIPKDSDETKPQEEELKDSTDPRFAPALLSDIASEKQLAKSAFTVINLGEIADTTYSLTSAYGSDPVNVTLIQQVVRNVLNVFKNLNASCKSYADLMTKEEDKKEILNIALQLQGKMRVLIAGVKGITSAPDDPAAKSGFGDACKQLTEGLQAFIAACESVRNRATEQSRNDFEQSILQALNSVRTYNIEGFFKLLTPLANAALRFAAIGEAKVLTVGSTASASEFFKLKKEILSGAQEMIDVGKSILKKPKFFLDRSEETLTPLEEKLKVLLAKSKTVLVGVTYDTTDSSVEKQLYVDAYNYVDQLIQNQSDQSRSLIGEHLESVKTELKKLTEEDFLPVNVAIDAASTLPVLLTKINVVATAAVPLQVLVWAEGLSHGSVKLKLSACGRCLGLPFTATDHYSNCVTTIASLVGSFVNAL